jgi:P4 family phage/plasmid primase-like protien
LTDTAILETAIQLHDAGLCVIPVAADGQKRPAVRWRQYTAAGGGEPRPDRDQLEAWFTNGQFDGLGIVCGAASGGLEMLEFEGRAVREDVAARLTELANGSGLGDLWQRVCSGYMEATPGGGIHLYYRVAGDDARNAKLASRPARDDELDDRERAVRAEKPHATFTRVLVETRAEGGFVVVAPSGGRSHPDGGSWVLLAGGPSSIPTLTVEERDALHHLGAAFDQMPLPDATPAAAAPPPSSPLFTQPASPYDDDGTPPGTDYNDRTRWEDILTPRGWTRVFTDSHGVTYWRRPGKKTGFSATTGRNDADNLYVWSTSTEFETERPYDKFGAHTLLEYGSTSPAALSSAAQALAAAGYGHRPEPTRAAPAPAAPPLVDPTPGPAPTPAVVVEERTLAHSDDGNALDLVQEYGTVIRYVPDRGRWLAWTGTLWEWQPVSGGLVREYAKRIARALPDEDKAATAHKKKALSANGVGAMLTQAATDVRVVTPFDQLDAHPWELNTPAGIVDLRTGLLGPSDASRLHTKVTRCAPDFGADRARWEEFLADTFNGDDELVGYLQRLVGYSATGSVAKHVLPFAVGSGGNGKGVFLESLTAVLGDYATTAPSGFLMAKASIQHETEIARLAGMRMVVCSEVADDDRFDEVKVKQLTGGDTLTARFMRQDHFTFRPSHHLWLMGNHQPTVRAGGRAFWRRLRLIPFLHEVPIERMVDDLQEQLAAEHGPALMAWIVQGAAAYAAGGLQEPESVTAATGAYAADQDTVARFVEEMCHLAPGSVQVQIKTARLREAYEKWAYGEGEEPVSAKKLTMELTRRYAIGQTRTGTARFYTGITIIEDEPNTSVTEPAERAPFAQPSQPEQDKIGGPGW